MPIRGTFCRTYLPRGTKACHNGGMQPHIGTPAVKVRGLAAERGLTQEDIGTILGRNRRYVGDRYRGKGEFLASELAKIATHFNVPVGALFGEVRS